MNFFSLICCKIYREIKKYKVWSNLKISCITQQLSLKKLWLPLVYSGFQKLLLESISHQKSWVQPAKNTLSLTASLVPIICFHWLNTPVAFWRRRSLYLKRVALNSQRLMDLWPSSCIQSNWNRLGVNFWWGRKPECPEETLEVRLRSTETQSTYKICCRGERSDWFFSPWYVKWPSIHNQYPWDTVKPAGLKNDVNSKHSIEHKYATLNSTWVASLFNCRTINLPFLAYKQTGQFLQTIAGLIYLPVTDCQITA